LTLKIRRALSLPIEIIHLTSNLEIECTTL